MPDFEYADARAVEAAIKAAARTVHEQTLHGRPVTSSDRPTTTGSCVGSRTLLTGSRSRGS